VRSDARKASLAGIGADHLLHLLFDKRYSDVVRTNELHVWFVAEHVVDRPVVRAE
jgi:hypothetical protein